MLWERPIYRFRIPKSGYGEESQRLQELVFDVTGSAPPMRQPSEALKTVLNEIFNSDSLKSIQSVLEFGAAKLKNIPFILEKGKTVCAVEFEELSKNPITKGNLRKCRAYGSQFQELLFPILLFQIQKNLI